MLIDSAKPHELPVPSTEDAPPSYNDIHPLPTPAIANQDQKNIAGPSSAQPSPSQSPKPIIPSGNSKGKEKAGWFTFGMSKIAKEVRSAVQGLVRDIVQQQITHASLPILESCAEACRANQLSFSALLQEPYIANHPPIYWAIIKRPALDDVSFLTAILSYSAPLLPKTTSEIRLACLQIGDQLLFQCLWRSPEFAVLSGSDQMLLGASVSPDTVEVEELAGDSGAFAARFEIVQFQKRVKIGGEVGLEFIARGRVVFRYITPCLLIFSQGRLWWLRFHVFNGHYEGVDRTGAWAVSLSILEHSSSTWLDSRVVIREPPRDSQLPATPRSNSGPLSSFMDSLNPGSSDSKPPITVRLKTDTSQPLTSLYPDRSPRTGVKLTCFLDDVSSGTTLQFS